MSRVGKKHIILPKGVSIDIDESKVIVSGPKGKLEKKLRTEINLHVIDDNIQVSCKDSSRKANAFRGLTRALVNNMVLGVSSGFERRLSIEGVGYRASVENNVLTLSVGYSNPVIFTLPTGVNASIEKNEIILNANDKELLGQTAARIRSIRRPEPYKGKGIRHANEYVARKVGKAAGKK